MRKLSITKGSSKLLIKVTSLLQKKNKQIENVNLRPLLIVA